MNKKLNRLFLGVMSIGILASCNKTKEDISPKEENNTIQNATDWNIEESEGDIPEFHMHYSADLSEEEANAKWKNDVENYRKRKVRSCNEFEYIISTYTGTGTNQNTDAAVKAHHHFEVDGDFMNHTVTLNNPGDDREGGWDFYYVTKSAPTTYLVTLKRKQIALKGTDGWYLRRWNVAI